MASSQGSALLIAIFMALVFVMLGLALFDLGTVESGLSRWDEANAKALEIAEAGLERALHLLWDDINATTSWADGSPAGTPTGTSFVAYSGLTNVAFAGGQYSVQLRTIDVTTANTVLGIPCRPDAGTPTNCADLLFIRSSGASSPLGGTVQREIEAVVRAFNFGPLGGILAGATSGATLNGNVVIAGSLTLLNCVTFPCLSLSGSAVVMNNYDKISAALQDRIPFLQRVRCTQDTTNGCESLGSTLSIDATPRFDPPSGPPYQEVQLTGNATVGCPPGSGCTGGDSNPVTGYKGKRTLDAIYITDGCQLANCSDQYNTDNVNNRVFSDNGPRSPFNLDASTTFPKLQNSVNIAGITYTHYASCFALNNCSASIVGVSPASTDDFFLRHAALVNTSTAGASSLITGLDNTTAAWNTPITYYTTGGGPTAINATLCWQPSGSGGTLSAITSGTCAAPTSLVPASYPALVYVDGDLNICAGCNNKTIYINGGMVFVAKGNFTMNASLLSSSVGNSPAAFPVQNIFSVLTPGSIGIGTGNSNMDVLGYYFAEGTSSLGFQTNIAGALAGSTLNFAGGGGNVPKIFEIPYSALPPTLFPPKNLTWSVRLRAWRECIPIAAASDAAPCATK